MREEVLVVVGCWLEGSLIGKDRQKVYKMKREIEEQKNGTDKEKKKKLNYAIFCYSAISMPSPLPSTLWSIFLFLCCSNLQCHYHH